MLSALIIVAVVIGLIWLGVGGLFAFLRVVSGWGKVPVTTLVAEGLLILVAWPLMLTSTAKEDD